MLKLRYRRLIAGLVIGGLMIGLAGILLQAQLFIGTNQGIYRVFPAKAGNQLSVSFIHSVERTPVTENFIITDSHILMLDSAEYQSFGVGLPFLATDGTAFQTEKDHFILSGMNRQFQRVELRTGPEAKLTLTYAGQTLPLYSIFEPGTLVSVWIGPMYSRWF